MPLVIYCLGGGHGHTNIPMSCTKVTLGNQVRASLWQVRAWFKNVFENQEINVKTFAHVASPLSASKMFQAGDA